MTGIYKYRTNKVHFSDIRYEWFYLAYFVLIAGILEAISIYRSSEKKFWSENMRPVTV